MLGWWVTQPPAIRFAVAFAPLLAGGVCFLVGRWQWGIAGVALGAVLLALSLPRPSERRGYHD